MSLLTTLDAVYGDYEGIAAYREGHAASVNSAGGQITRQNDGVGVLPSLTITDPNANANANAFNLPDV